MNCSIPIAIQSRLRRGDNLVIHAPHPSRPQSHDLVGFTIDHNLFLRSSLVLDLNGKGKLGGKEDVSPRECANSGPSKGGKNSITKEKNDVRANTD